MLTDCIWTSGVFVCL